MTTPTTISSKDKVAATVAGFVAMLGNPASQKTVAEVRAAAQDFGKRASVRMARHLSIRKILEEHAGVTQ